MRCLAEAVLDSYFNYIRYLIFVQPKRAVVYPAYDPERLMVSMRIFKSLMILGMLVVAVAYWRGSRPKQDIDWSAVNANTPQQASAAGEGVLATGFTLKTLEGKEVSLSSFKGKPVLLNFWATWCPPCLEELPSLLKFASMAKQKYGLETIAVSIDTTDVPVRKLFQKKKFWPGGDLPLTILMDTNAAVAGAYGSSKFPESFFLDADLRIVRRFTGAQDWTSQETLKWISQNVKTTQ
jgi:thiol-disulfide isomerase/thioredoxin